MRELTTKETYEIGGGYSALCPPDVILAGGQAGSGGLRWWNEDFLPGGGDIVFPRDKGPWCLGLNC